MKAEIFEKSFWSTRDFNKEDIPEIEKFLKECGFEILGTLSHDFAPQGFSCVILIAESHFAIHTFPEEKQTYIQISSCSEEYYNNFVSREDQLLFI